MCRLAAMALTAEFSVSIALLEQNLAILIACEQLNATVGIELAL